LFELNQLRGFVAVAEELHFGRPAERLHRPPLSRQVQILERVPWGSWSLPAASFASRQLGRLFLLEVRRILHLAEGAAVSAGRGACWIKDHLGGHDTQTRIIRRQIGTSNRSRKAPHLCVGLFAVASSVWILDCR
jgi:DNA-binding transcriptional LysR family regulator